jgi:hypothetical protein
VLYSRERGTGVINCIEVMLVQSLMGAGPVSMVIPESYVLVQRRDGTVEKEGNTGLRSDSVGKRNNE